MTGETQGSLAVPSPALDRPDMSVGSWATGGLSASGVGRSAYPEATSTEQR
jgi:hypothetical protein